MPIQLYNTLTRRKETLKPLQKNKVGMYVCGPTVYDRAHLGNARSVVVYDVLYRLLRHEYGEKNVTYVRNITDVDDKINKAAKENNETIQQLTKRVTGWFHEDMAALNCLPPTVEPKATEHMPEMIAMIRQLIANDCAYVAEGHVLFDVHAAMKQGLNYGALSGRRLEELEAGARVAVEDYKKNSEDFVLWKPTPAGDDPSSVFDSPWGKGRPGWHIECSAMSTKYLGTDFDIHGGGADLKFPHHENEIAQSCCAHPNSHFAHLWVHNGFLTVEGEKMSKSLGNFTTVRELLDKGIKGEVIRYVFLKTHYREPLDWNQKAVEDAKKFLDRSYRTLFNVIELGGERFQHVVLPEINAEFLGFLKNDMNISKAITWLNELIREINKENNVERQYKMALDLMVCGRLLGIYEKDFYEEYGIDEQETQELYSVQILADNRIAAKKSKNFAEADRLRALIEEKGYTVEDKRDGTYELRKL